MSMPSSLSRLPEEIQELIERMWGEGASIDQLTEFLRSQLGEEAPSRSAVGRYTQRLKEQQERASERNAYLRDLMQCFPAESRENLTVVLAEQLKVKVFEFIAELEGMYEFRSEKPDKYAALVNNLGRALQSFELALNNNQKRRHEERKALLDEVRAKLEQDNRLNQDALRENMDGFYEYK